MLKQLLIGFTFFVLIFTGFSVSSKSVKTPTVKTPDDNLLSRHTFTYQPNKEFNGFDANFSAVKSSFVSAFLPTAIGSVRFDFNGDGKADLARWQASSTEWKVKNSLTGSYSTNNIGSAASLIVPADFDGDGKTDAAVFNPSAGSWTIKLSFTGTTQTISNFGTTGDNPVYDGDGKADVALWRPSTRIWYYKSSNNGGAVVASSQFGDPTNIAVPGNYDGDSKMDYAVWRPSNGNWYVLPGVSPKSQDLA